VRSIFKMDYRQADGRVGLPVIHIFRKE